MTWAEGASVAGETILATPMVMQRGSRIDPEARSRAARLFVPALPLEPGEPFYNLNQYLQGLANSDRSALTAENYPPSKEWRARLQAAQSQIEFDIEVLKAKIDLQFSRLEGQNRSFGETLDQQLAAICQGIKTQATSVNSQNVHYQRLICQDPVWAHPLVQAALWRETVGLDKEGVS